MDMDTADIRNLAAKVNKLADGARSTGPRTEAGKLRSALNATRHGLAGRNLLLPGEDPVEYETRMDEIFSTLAPRDAGEAQLVALVADDTWKLGRLARIEKGITLGRIEELLALTGSGKKAGTIVNAIHQMGNALVTWTAEPVPTTRSPDFNRRYTTMAEAVALVHATVIGIPVSLIEACDAALDEVRGKRDDVAISLSSYTQVFQVARELMTALLDTGRAQDVEQDELRAAIAGIALPDEAELKKLARYRSMLELSVQRRLVALEQLRKLVAGNEAGEKDLERAKEFRVRLRIVA